MLAKVVAVQSELGHRLSLKERLFIFRQRPDFVCLPEYSLIDRDTTSNQRAAMMIDDNLAYLQELSGSLATCLVAGTIVEADDDSLYNSCYLFERGQAFGRYRKLCPTASEINHGIMPGDKLFVKSVDGIKFAILICADALNTDLFEILFDKKVDIIFIPTVSPLRPDESNLKKFVRDEEIFTRGAQKAASYVVKTCGVGEIFGKPLQGRSLITSPWGIIKRVEPHAEQYPTMLTAVLDITEIREFAAKKRVIAGALK